MRSCVAGISREESTVFDMWRQAKTQPIPWKNKCIRCPFNMYYEPRVSKQCSNSLGQEEIVVSLLAGKSGLMHQNGTFLEIGGGDGLHESNTMFLEACLGWRGILVEPNPRLASAMCLNRPRAVSVSTGVCSPPATSMAFDVFYKQKGAGMEERWTMAGSPEYLNPEIRSFHNRSIRTKHMRVPCSPLSLLLRGIRHIDYFSLDVEGAEARVLDSVNWDELSVTLIEVEQSASSPHKNAKVRSKLVAQGFVHVYTHWIWPRHIADEFFLHQRFLSRHLPFVARIVLRRKSVYSALTDQQSSSLLDEIVSSANRSSRGL